MDNITFSLSIPLDEDGFLEMECDYCKGRFMLTKETFEDDGIHLVVEGPAYYKHKYQDYLKSSS